MRGLEHGHFFAEALYNLRQIADLMRAGVGQDRPQFMRQGMFGLSVGRGFVTGRTGLAHQKGFERDDIDGFGRHGRNPTRKNPQKAPPLLSRRDVLNGK